MTDNGKVGGSFVGYIMELRKLVGTRPIMMVGVTVLVKNAEGHLLLQKRTDSFDWGTIGGSLDLGESYEEAELVGMIGIRQLFSYEIDEVVTQISVVVTKREFRRKGIGKALVQYVEDWSKKHGSEIIVLTSGIKEERTKAHEFYKSRDFDITGYRFDSLYLNVN